MKLRELKALYLDCQTTGIRPPKAHLLEFAWAIASAQDENLEVESRLVALPEGSEIPAIVKELTGITEEEMKEAKNLEEIFTEFRKTLNGEPAFIHYAQFEKPFLADLFQRFAGQEEIPFKIFCTQQLTKRVLPNLPSQNIRGAAGYFGLAPGGLKRATHHARATHQIWRGLLGELAKQGIETLPQLEDFLEQAPQKKTSRYEYRLDRIKRLELPDSPGIYRMIAKSGEILYVGKATSLKSRVNSYFRGFKGRDRRKLEMLAQVWDLKVTTCATPLEAALMETDEIKRYNPPYNVALKRGRRHLVFYSNDFSKASMQQTAEFPHGPFRNSNWIEHLRLLFHSLQQEEFAQIFFNPIAPATLKEGWEIFCAVHGLKEIRSVRTLLAQGMWFHKNYVEPEEEQEETADRPAEDEAEEIEREPTPEEVAEKFARLLRRSAAEYLRTKKLSRLLNARVTFTSPAGERHLSFRRGILNGDQAYDPTSPWDGLGIDDFDRMSILLSELAGYEHKIEL